MNQKKSVFKGMLTLVLVLVIIASAVNESQGCSTGGELADAFNCEDGRGGTKGMYIHKFVTLRKIYLMQIDRFIFPFL